MQHGEGLRYYVVSSRLIPFLSGKVADKMNVSYRSQDCWKGSTLCATLLNPFPELAQMVKELWAMFGCSVRR